MGFAELIGHDRAVRTLKSMMEAERLPHALLIAGPKGVGKRMLALALAQAVNCEEPNGLDGCGRCLSCQKIGRGMHPDVKEVEPEGKSRRIKIDDIRDLRVQIGFRPYEGRYKVFVIREADRMGEEAANALLKTLEEPPPSSLLLLTTPEESDLLPTIVSRCLKIALAPLPISAVENWLAAKRGLSGPAARLAAAMSGGCLGRVLDLDIDEAWNRRREVTERLSALAAGQVRPALQWAASLAEDPDHWMDHLHLFRMWYRDLMIQAGGGRPESLVNVDLADEIVRIASIGRPVDFIFALDRIDQAQDALDRFIRPDLVFENLILALADIGDKHGKSSRRPLS